MSSGADCRFYEKKDGWRYDLQQYPYGCNEEYDTFGPFDTFRSAQRHLDRNHSNPGGYWIDALPGCKHDLARPMSYPQGEDTHYCDRCGAQFKLEVADA